MVALVHQRPRARSGEVTMGIVIIVLVIALAKSAQN